jgi:hypothetical protein
MRAHSLHRPLAMADRADPERKVLRPVVVADAISVVNRLTLAQGSPELCLHHDTVLVHSPRALSNHYVSGGVDPPVRTPAPFGGHGLANADPPVRGAIGHNHLEGLAPSCAPGYPHRCRLTTGTVAGGLKHLKRFQSLGRDLPCPRRTLR